MPEFLSDEWLQLLQSSLPEVDPALDIRIDYVIGDVHYRIRAHHGRLVIEPPAGEADLTLTLSAAAAADLASGRVQPRVVLRSGKVRVRGDLSLLGLAAAGLTPDAARLEEVRRHTGYP